MQIDKLIAIDDSAKPNDIASSNWIKKGQKYTPIKIVTSKLNREQYFVLEEIITGNPLYGGYNVKRFGIDINDILEMIEKGELVEEFV